MLWLMMIAAFQSGAGAGPAPIEAELTILVAEGARDRDRIVRDVGRLVEALHQQGELRSRAGLQPESDFASCLGLDDERARVRCVRERLGPATDGPASVVLLIEAANWRSGAHRLSCIPRAGAWTSVPVQLRLASHDSQLVRLGAGLPIRDCIATALRR